MAQSIRVHAFLLTFTLACGGTVKATDPGPKPASHGTSLAANEPSPSADPAPAPAGQLDYPRARRQPIREQLHAVEVSDPYRWMEDPNDPEVEAWLEANDKLARGKLAALPYRDALAARFRELLYIDYVSAPIKRRGRYFYTRRHKDREKAIVYWKQGQNGTEGTLFDPNRWSEDGTVSLGDWYPSYDGNKVAYQRKINNADEATMYLRDVSSGTDSQIDVIEGAKYAEVSWTPTGEGFYYTYLPTDPSIPVDERPGHQEVRFHRIGGDPKRDEIVFPHTGSPQMWIRADVSRDGRWLVLRARRGRHHTDVYFKDLGTKSAIREVPIDGNLPVRERIKQEAQRRGFRVLVYGQDATYEVYPWKNKFYILTNEGAPKYRVLAVNPRKPQRRHWKEIVAETESTISSASVVGHHLVLHYLRNAFTDIEVRKLSGKHHRKVALPNLGSGKLSGEPDDDEAYFSFTSFTQPQQVYKTSIKSGLPRLWSEVKIPVDTSAMQVEQKWFRSKDGTNVPMFLVHRRDLQQKDDGSNPTLLYGYGGFNISIEPAFSALAITWVERGGVYAVANLRGGGEFGEAWHQGGMLTSKQNVFDDFIAAAEFLIQEGYTSPAKLAIRGGSNGGLLVGAVMTQRPDLYGAVVCHVPLLDMVRYHRFGGGRTWIPEYGTAEDPEQFQALYRYSPYHRVEKGVEYPALLMMAADADDRVDPLHARKFTAAIQWASSGDRPYLLRVEKHSGHGGADLVKAEVEKYADTVAFLMWQLGMKG